MHGNSVKILIGVFIASVLLFIVTSPLLMIQTESAAIITCVIFQAFTTVVWKGKTLAVICYDTYW